MSWITDRAGFDVDAVFHEMIRLIQRDIEEMNELGGGSSQSRSGPVFYMPPSADSLSREIKFGIVGARGQYVGHMTRPLNEGYIYLVSKEGEEFRIYPVWDRKKAERRLIIQRMSEDFKDDPIDYDDLEILVQEFLEPAFFKSSV